MLAGFTLAIAIGALLAAIVAILLALYAIGQGATHEKRTSTIEIQHAEMQGHRLRGIMSLIVGRSHRAMNGWKRRH